MKERVNLNYSSFSKKEMEFLSRIIPKKHWNDFIEIIDGLLEDKCNDCEEKCETFYPDPESRCDPYS